MKENEDSGRTIDDRINKDYRHHKNKVNEYNKRVENGNLQTMRELTQSKEFIDNITLYTSWDQWPVFQGVIAR